MKTFLYVGNHLSESGSNPSVAETLALVLVDDLNFRLVSKHINPVLRLLDMIFNVIKNRKTNQPVLIDIYSTKYFYFAILISIFCRLISSRYYCVLHGGRLPERLIRSKRLSHIIFSNAVINIAPSNYLYKSFTERGFSALVIPNPIEIDNYPWRLRRNVGMRLLWVRAFDEIYNPQMAIKIVHQLKANLIEVRLCMVGPDKDESLIKCRNLVKELGLEEDIDFLGRLSKKEWIDMSRNFDIFLNTTNFDNTPVSLIEAMALGLPVVSTNAGGLPDLIDCGTNGLLSDCNDVKAMASNINRLAENPELVESLSRGGRLKAESFATERVRQDWLNLLKDYS